MQNRHLIICAWLIGVCSYLVFAESNECVFGDVASKYDNSSLPKCSNGGYLIRTLGCSNEIIPSPPCHVCCDAPLQSELQESRQTWFRAITFLGDLISPECSKQIYCEQACKDNLEVGPRADYPQVLEGDSDANREYVQSWNEGECQACHNRKSTAQNRKHSERYSGKSCERECGLKYPRCKVERSKSIIMLLYYRTARIFHKLGMFLFDLTHHTDSRDMLNQLMSEVMVLMLENHDLANLNVLD